MGFNSLDYVMNGGLIAEHSPLLVTQTPENDNLIIDNKSSYLNFSLEISLLIGRRYLTRLWFNR